MVCYPFLFSFFNPLFVFLEDIFFFSNFFWSAHVRVILLLFLARFHFFGFPQSAVHFSCFGCPFSFLDGRLGFFCCGVSMEGATAWFRHAVNLGDCKTYVLKGADFPSPSPGFVGPPSPLTFLRFRT